MDLPNTFLLEIVSDTICPWCYMGKRRLETALAALGDEISFELRWRPFELNPDMPRAGMDRKSYRSAKFGSWKKSLDLDAQVKAAGASDGIDFRHDRIEKTPNTLASHVLISLAGEAGNQNNVVEALFRAFFVDGKDLADLEVLAVIGVRVGLDPALVEQALNDEERRVAIGAAARALSQSGINAVPTVLLNRFSLFSGAQSPDVIARALRSAAGNKEIIASGKTLVRV